MEFNVAKCKNKHLGTGNIKHDYSMKGRQLDVVAIPKGTLE